MKVVLIDYGAGNIQSIQFALQRLGIVALLSKDPNEIRSADKVIFPGVGQASFAMKKLKEASLDSVIPELTQPVLGICLGMQLMCDATEEGNTKGLGIFKTKALRFNQNLKVPQVGWNEIRGLKSPLFEGVNEETYMYLVHSYYVPLTAYTIAQTTYGLPYSSGLRKDNFFGVQFHPEKSSKAGSVILQNFLNLTND
ncbi:imidazole glycerol phosphate synthase subunit HisH [Flavobacteriaceae bacterium F08102]|nr:imidazole glycerol phosphate synthase subunit HisH [Flavobacteriaceae bacterium F08102]